MPRGWAPCDLADMMLSMDEAQHRRWSLNENQSAGRPEQLETLTAETAAGVYLRQVCITEYFRFSDEEQWAGDAYTEVTAVSCTVAVMKGAKRQLRLSAFGTKTAMWLARVTMQRDAHIVARSVNGGESE